MKLTPLFCFLLLSFHLKAQQIIVLEQDSVSQVNENVDISNNFKDFPLDLYFKNNTDDTIMVNWRRELGENCPEEWDIITADQIITYVASVNESQIPIPMTHVDPHFIVREIFFPRTVPGCCDIKMIFSLEGAANNPIDTGYYHIEINEEGCMISFAHEANRKLFKIYPIPAQDILNIENIDLVKSIKILDITGKEYNEGIYQNDAQIDISILPMGTYFCNIQTKNGQQFIRSFLKI